MAWDKAFLSGLSTGMEMGIARKKLKQSKEELDFNKWLKKEELQYTKSASDLALKKLDYDIANRNEDVAFKYQQEARRTKESDLRSGLYEKRNKVYDVLFGGQGGLGGGVGGNLPAGSTMSFGGLTMPLNRKYTEVESKSLSGSGAILKDLSELKNMFLNKKVGAYGQGMAGAGLAVSNLPFGVGAPLAAGLMGVSGLGKGGVARQNYTDLMRNVANRLLYLRSGAQINEQEYKRFMAQLPALVRADSLDVKQLDRFMGEFEALQGRIESGALWDKNKKQFVGGQASTTPTSTVDLDKIFSGLETPVEE